MVSRVKLYLTTNGEKCPAICLTEVYNIQCVYLQNIQGACGPINNWANGLNRFISKEEILMGNRHMEICPTALTTEKWKLYYTEISSPLVGMVTIKITTNDSRGKRNPYSLLAGTETSTCTMETSIEVHWKHTKITHNPVTPLLSIHRQD